MTLFVMAGLDPGAHVFAVSPVKNVDGRGRPRDDAPSPLVIARLDRAIQ
jgi:hypothetical protein